MVCEVGDRSQGIDCMSVVTASSSSGIVVQAIPRA